MKPDISSCRDCDKHSASADIIMALSVSPANLKLRRPTLKTNAALVLLAIMCQITGVLSFEIHLSSFDPGGTDLAFTSLNSSNVTHKIQAKGSRNRGIMPFISHEVISNEKVLHFKKPKDCHKLRSNPVYFNVISYVHSFKYDQHKPSATSVSLHIPYFLYMHGHGCDVLHKKWLYKVSSKHKRGQNQHKVHMHLQSVGGCESKQNHTLSLRDYIPLQYDNCSLQAIPLSYHIHVNPQNASISFEDNFCLSEEFRIEIQISLNCPNLINHAQIVPYTFIFHKSHQHAQSHKSIKKFTNHSRVKRQITNTAPSFVKEEYVAHVQEGQDAGLPVITMLASDSDTGEAGLLSYSMNAMMDTRSADKFNINPDSGSVSTTVILDREFMSNHYFLITAMDNASPDSERKSATATLTIIVDDINDHTPTFSSATVRIMRPESYEPGREIYVANALDSDIGNNAKIQYSILNMGGANNAFRINPVSGSISTLTALDRETVDTYRLIIQAIDQGNERRSSTFTLSIQVEDENDNYPIFQDEPYTVRLPENTPVSSSNAIITITATDMDEGDNGLIAYRLSPTSDTFRIDAATGKLYLIRPLDYEDEQDYTLSVWADDHGKSQRRERTEINIQVIDVNDNRPEFLEPSYSRIVDENILPGSRVVQVLAEDRDSGDNSLLVYSFVNPPQNIPFEIESETGQIKTKQNLDREGTSQYRLTVKAQDSAAAPKSATVSVTITVRDVNDNHPVFQERSYNATISEESKVGTLVTTILATDADEGDNARITYTIDGGNDQDAFQVRQSQGQGILSVKTRLDARQQNKYVLTVTATDVDGKKDSVLVYVNILDTNRFDPVLQGKDQYSVDVSEDTPIGTSIFQALALDNDRGENQRITYSLDPATVFSIDPNTGVIRTRKLLDRDSSGAYFVTVTARDNGQPHKQDSNSLDITITDVNDNKPEFSQYEYSGNITENSPKNTVVMRVTAIDKDAGANGQVRYTFEGGNGGDGTFSIDNQGLIRLLTNVDREEKAFYNLVAVAVDSSPTDPQSASVIVHVKVLDLNDNPPKFEFKEFNVMIEENSPISSTVAMISAVDPDEGVNKQVVYSLLPGRDSDSFRLNSRPGEAAIITTGINLDYDEGKQVYVIVLQAASETLIDQTTVKINVQDVNDHKPVLENFYIIFNNFRGAFIDAPIGRVPAFDKDVSDREKLRYEILSGNGAELISLNASTGEVTLDPRLDSDVARSGTLEVKVTDGKYTARATCWLWVRLVTHDMLHSAVTIRLDGMTSQSFLSPLLKYFREALAHIFKTDEADIFEINIEDDTSVLRQVLNVSVSVRQKTVLDQGQSRDVFYTPEYIREIVYLHRGLLANLSTVHVLPFDDNLCLVEPCPNHETCHSVVTSGQPRPFIHSPTVLFRPVHPRQIFACRCPHGFAGLNQSKMCDYEIDLCYSFPCQNNGQCLRHESGYTCVCAAGYTGAHCEVDLSAPYTALTCPAHQCLGSSHCSPLVGGGFTCDGCSHSDDPQCRQTARHFPRGSYLTFPSIKTRNRFTIEMRLATQATHGLLLYNGRFNGEHDFIALELVDGQLRFSFCLGSNVTSQVTTNIDGGVSTGQWVYVKVEYLSRNATVTVGEDCDTEIAIRYGSQLGQFPCAVRVTEVLAPECASLYEPCNRLLDLTGPLQLGGLPDHHASGQVEVADFVGCLKDVTLDHKLLDLNASVANHLTGVGCPPRAPRCDSNPCRKGGVCSEGWNDYKCVCPEGAGGKDCSQTISPSRQMYGQGHMTFTRVPDPVVRSDLWVNGVAFRTRTANGALMQILLNSGEVLIKIVNGLIHYQVSGSEVIFMTSRVDDGLWHYLEVRWDRTARMDMFLDYGQFTTKFNMSNPFGGKTIELVYIGASKEANKPLSNHFTGCVKDIRVGNTHTSLLRAPDTDENTDTGCAGSLVCQAGVCGAGRCVDHWNSYTCDCPKGAIGAECKDVCTNFNPCQNWGDCRMPGPKEEDYRCECGARQSGRYCEDQSPASCPSGWWGQPVCGPCGCDTDKGFLQDCDKHTGECQCKAFHYLPPDSDTCLPCDCYETGSTDMSCDATTGQCHCQPGVIGRQCDQCENIFAAVIQAKVEGEDGSETIVVGCRVFYDDCPRDHAAAIWWEPIVFGMEAVQDCPKGSSGNATRGCTLAYSWREPDLFECTSDSFKALEPELQTFESGKVSPSMADYTIEQMKNVSYVTTPIYGGDILMTYRYTKVILEYEIAKPSLSMISQQYRDFVQKLLVVLSNVTDDAYAHYWLRVGALTGGCTHLLNLVEQFVAKLVQQLPEIQSGTFEAVSDDMVLGTDFLNLVNFSGVTVPKYDNNVRTLGIDKEVSITLPLGAFSQDEVTRTKRAVSEPKAFLSYAIYRDFAKHVDMNTDDSIRRTHRPMTINSPMITLVIANVQMETLTPGPTFIKFRLTLPNNRTNMHCARWIPHSNNKTGVWSGSGCVLEDSQCLGGEGSDVCEEFHVTCVCTEPRTYAVIVDVADGTEHIPPVVDMEALAYVLTVLSLLLLMLSFVVLFTFKRLQCNWNSIRINIIFTLMIIQLAYVIGINQVTPLLFCRLVAIALHYFYMACFAWMFVEVLHMYRLLTEKQTINYGAMKFYYLLGYVIPGIIVGLAVGLYTDAYGNDSFCWLQTSEGFIWSFAGPVTVGAILIVITFVFALKASYGDKLPCTDVTVIWFGLLTVILLLLLVSATWVVGLISVNYRLTGLHYLHAVLMLMDGLFIFLFYVLMSKKVRWCAKRFYYRLKGKKVEFDDIANQGRNSVQQSRSALSYRHESPSDLSPQRSVSTPGTHVGLTNLAAMSTISRSTKSSKADKYLHHSTSSSATGVPPVAGITSIPYMFESPFKEKPKQDKSGKLGADSDSDSDASLDRNSLELASSHSSDEDDEFDMPPGWDSQVPRSKTVEQALEQIEKKKKDKERDRLGSPEDLMSGQDSPGGRVQPHIPLGPNPPDVTLSTLHNRPTLPVRTDSLPLPSSRSSPAPGTPAQSSPRPGITVPVLTHNGSISSESESSSDETTV